MGYPVASLALGPLLLLRGLWVSALWARHVVDLVEQVLGEGPWLVE